MTANQNAAGLDPDPPARNSEDSGSRFPYYGLFIGLLTFPALLAVILTLASELGNYRTALTKNWMAVLYTASAIAGPICGIWFSLLFAGVRGLASKIGIWILFIVGFTYGATLLGFVLVALVRILVGGA